MAKNIRWHQKPFLWWRLHPNRRYKDRLFRFIFQDKQDLLELYNAVNGSAYTDADALDIVTLDDVLFMKMKNDLSFLIDNRLNLYEHQSTDSPNMPLRGLLYFARQYEGLAAERGDNLYGTKLVKLPTPEYRIFYNGKQERPDKKELFLSDAFEDGRGSGCLECRALMLNINRGHNQELMEKCRRLREYSEFIAEVGDNLDKGMSLKSAVTKAMDHCIQEGILEDVLKKSRAEVLNMLLTEYDEKKHMKSIYEEGREDGYSEGEQAGRQAGEREMLKKLIQKKLKRGKSAAVIAEELEEEITVIEEIVESLKK